MGVEWDCVEAKSERAWECEATFTTLSETQTTAIQNLKCKFNDTTCIISEWIQINETRKSTLTQTRKKY